VFSRATNVDGAPNVKQSLCEFLHYVLVKFRTVFYRSKLVMNFCQSCHEVNVNNVLHTEPVKFEHLIVLSPGAWATLGKSVAVTLTSFIIIIPTAIGAVLLNTHSYTSSRLAVALATATFQTQFLLLLLLLSVSAGGRQRFLGVDGKKLCLH